MSNILKIRHIGIQKTINFKENPVVEIYICSFSGGGCSLILGAQNLDFLTHGPNIGLWGLMILGIKDL